MVSLMLTLLLREVLGKDVLSPYLFVLAINGLLLALQDALADHSLSGVVLGLNCPPIHSFLFADDLLICGTATVEESLVMKQILQ